MTVRLGAAPSRKQPSFISSSILPLALCCAGMLKALKNVPDGRTEIDVEITCWVPLVGRLLPKDRIKIWKVSSKDSGFVVPLLPL